MITESNQYFNPADFDYEVIGFLEELAEVGTNKLLGFRRLQGLPTRPLGSPGVLRYTITENIEVSRGHKTGIIIKASKKKPLHVEGMIIALGGK